jgi:glycosyltransferase involved in cell wall biosynthesis
MSSATPKISIGLPVYNGELFIQETLRSLVNQSFADFEIIISDNASTDKTESICRSYADQDSRIRYYKNPHNVGAAKNYNITFELSRGKYFKWAAHDDLCAPEYLEQCIEVLESLPSVVLSYPREILIDEHGKEIKRRSNTLNIRSSKPHKRFEHFHDLWRERGFTFGNPVFGLIRADVLRKTNLIGNHVASDLTLLGELILYGEFYEVPDYLFFFRVHSQTSRAVRESFGFEGLAVWFDPKNQGKIILPNFSMLNQQLLAVNRVEMSMHEKSVCYAQIGKWITHKWKALLKEAVMASTKTISRAFL